MIHSLPAEYAPYLFPAILFVFYFISWLLVGRDPKIKTVSPRYEPPPGVSPGVARYIETGGSDGTTLAAVAASLAVKGVVGIQPAAKTYRLELLNASKSVSPDEAALVKTLFHVEVPAEPYAASNTAIIGTASRNPKNPSNNPQSLNSVFRAGQARPDNDAFSDNVAEAETGTAVERQSEAQTQAIIDPAAPDQLKHHLDAIQSTFRKNLDGIYFRHNYIYCGLGTLATFIWGLGTALFLDANSSLFVTFWLLMFTSMAGLVIGGIWTSKPLHPTPAQRVGRVLVPLLFFAVPGALIYFVFPDNHGFVPALLLSVLLNNVFFVIMRAPTAQGRTTLQQLDGFREFLLRVEQDRLDRMNSPAERAELMDRFLPYAIALGVREGWGDTMAAALSDAIVER
jgi:hypothetical protein